MNTGGKMRTRLCYCAAFCAALLLVSLAGCKFITINTVATNVDLQVEGRDADGMPWRASAGEIVRQPLYPGSTERFTRPLYDGPLVSWRMNAIQSGPDYETSQAGLDILIRNKLAETLCFCFDRALLSSNLHPQEVPMRVRLAVQNSTSKPNVPHPNPQGERQVVIPPSFCFEPGEPNTVGFIVEMAELFPSGSLFDLRWEGRSTRLLNPGIGNWLRMRLPIEHAGKREEVTVTMTVMDSKAHVQLY